MKPGDRLGPYEVLAKLGEGGMGEVYRARDTRLDRTVAIKVLPSELSTDPERRARFEREARAIASLAHPHICTLHDIGQHDGIIYLVMEHVEGKTLDAMIPRAGMRLSEVLRLAVQISRALTAAHAHGIVHRDLKPTNIMVASDGAVKVLDFGLARLTETAADAGASEASTVQARTGAGVILGTAAYMSPEQAEGKPVDARSDIFSFGAMLYEMATGRRAFAGDSWASTISAVLSQEPKRPEGLPGELQRIVLRCLRKDPGKRFQHMDDVCVALEELKEESDSGKLGAAVPAPARFPRRRRLLYGAAGVCMLLAVAAVAWRWVGPRAEPASVKLVPLTTFPGYENAPAFSPDGKQVAFSWTGPKEDNRDIYVMLVGTATPVRLTTDAAFDGRPAWSPDGRRIAFVRIVPGKQSVMLMSALGGSEREVAETNQRTSGLDWSPDGKYVAFPADSARRGVPQIVLLSPDTGERRVLTSPPAGELGDGAPRFSPDGQSLAFLRESQSGRRSIGVISLADRGAVVRIVTPPTARLYDAAFAWTRDSRQLVFSASYEGIVRGLWRMAADGRTPPVQALGAGQNIYELAIAPQGSSLAYTQTLDDTNIWRLDLGRGRPAGAPINVIASTLQDTAPDFSPDGRRIAFVSNRSGVYEIWVSGADGSSQGQVTRMGAPVSGSPRWSPDGGTIAFDSDAGGDTDIYTVSADGGPPKRLTNQAGLDAIPTWSRDGRWIYFSSDRTGSIELWKMPAEGGAPLQLTKHGGVNAMESGDGKTLYYAKGVTERGMWKMPIGGGQEVPVLDAPAPGRWGQVALTSSGLYYIARDGTDLPARFAIFFYDFASRKTTRVAQLARPPRSGQRGLALSTDGRTFLFTQQDASGSDLMMLENFR